MAPLKKVIYSRAEHLFTPLPNNYTMFPKELTHLTAPAKTKPDPAPSVEKKVEEVTDG